MSGMARAESFEKLLDWSGAEISWTLTGGSFIKDGKLIESAEMKAAVPAASDIEFRAYLIWCGEVGKLDDAVSRITLTTPKGAVVIKCQKLYSERSTGHLYTAVSDITEILRKTKGPYFLSGIRSDPMDFARENGLSQAGWELFTVERKGVSGNRRIKFFAGTEAVAPGEPFNLSLWNDGAQAKINRLGIAGGHGIAGNAGATLINGKSLSGGDDWRGNRGELWDSHVYDLSKWPQNRGWTVTFDPLLEWIFPSCAIAEFLLY